MNTPDGASLFSVFVYGTLKPGEANYSQYCQGKVIQSQPAIARGHLYDLLLGYPAFTSGDGWVQGVLLRFSDVDVLADLDQLEDYCCDRAREQNEYQRNLIEVFTPEHQPLGWGWVYWMALEKIHELGGILLPDGCWGSKFK